MAAVRLRAANAARTKFFIGKSPYSTRPNELCGLDE
jgi:hypothetical protein